MSSLPLSIQAATAFLEQHDSATRVIRSLLDHKILNKSLSFRKTDFQDSYDQLKLFDRMITQTDLHFQLNLENLINLVVLDRIARDTMNEPIPGEPSPALAYAENFCELIRKPNLRHYWYGNLELNFESFTLIWLNQEKGVDITNYAKSITEDLRDQYPYLRTIDQIYLHGFPYFTDPVDIQYLTAVTMVETTKTRDSAGQMLQDMGRINPQKAEELYRHAKSAVGETNLKIRCRLIIGLYPTDEHLFLVEATELFHLDAVQGLLAITWLPYTDVEVIQKAFAFMESSNVNAIEYLRDAPTFYIRLIENKNTPENLVELCFAKIKFFTQFEDQALRSNLLWRTGMIKNRDKKKFELLPDFIAWGSADALREYFDHFTTPKELFLLVRDAFLQDGLKVNIGLLSHALEGQYSRNQAAFEKELAALLSDDLAILRFAGLQVISSHYGGLFTFDWSELDEERQRRIIDTLLGSPANIEEILLQVLAFRKSEYPVVLEKLTADLVGLVPAYESHLIDLLLPAIDKNLAVDNELARGVQAAYDQYKAELDAKATIKEFDPFENERGRMEAFYRLEQEIHAENMEKAQAGSFLVQMGGQVTIIRGSGWKSEAHPNISLLQPFSVSRLMDRRYYSNPDKYEWRFRMNAIGKNYTKTSQ